LAPEIQMVFVRVTLRGGTEPGVGEFVSLREQRRAGGPLCAGGDVGSREFAAVVPKEGLREGQKGPKSPKCYQVAASWKSRAR